MDNISTINNIIFPGAFQVRIWGKYRENQTFKTLGNTAQLRLRISADLLRQFCSSKNGKYIQYSRVFGPLNWHKISR